MDAWGGMEEAVRRASQAASDFASDFAASASDLAASAPWAGGNDEESESDLEGEADPPEVGTARALLRPVVSASMSRQLRDHASFLDNILQHRDKVAECAGELLFGRPECGARNTVFWLRHKAPADLFVESHGLDRRPRAEELQEEENEQKLTADLRDVWVRALNINDEPTVLEFLVSGAVGCEKSLIPEVLVLLDVLPRVSQALLRTAAPGNPPEPHHCRLCFMRLLPSTFRVLRRVVVMKSLSIREASSSGKLSALEIEVPVDFTALAKHYERVGSLLRAYENLSVSVRHPRTGALLFEFSIQSDIIRIRFHVLDGNLAYRGEDEIDPVPFTVGAEGVELVVDCDISLRLLGMSLAAVPLPRVQLLLSVRAGEVTAQCRAAGAEDEAKSQKEEADAEDWMASISNAAWAAAESAANSVYDFQLLRSLLHERLSFELRNEPSGAEAAQTRFGFRFAMPYAPSAEMVSQCLKQFFTEQLKNMDLIALFRDIIIAFCEDLDWLRAARASGFHGAGYSTSARARRSLPRGSLKPASKEFL